MGNQVLEDPAGRGGWGGGGERGMTTARSVGSTPTQGFHRTRWARLGILSIQNNSLTTSQKEHNLHVILRMFTPYSYPQWTHGQSCKLEALDLERKILLADFVNMAELLHEIMEVERRRSGKATSDRQGEVGGRCPLVAVLQPLCRSRL